MSDPYKKVNHNSSPVINLFLHGMDPVFAFFT